MSASLVGSEMCIRDSFTVENLSLYAVYEAVSYTHLTLPTKLEV
ncbi:hypothetical protein JMUB7547_28840 [Staphylococcus aureus]